MNEETRLPALQAGGTVRAIVPQTFEEAWRIANAVCVAGMAPKGLSTPEQATIAIMHGLEVGMPPMMALQSIAVINGRPTVWGDGALALCLASPLCQGIKETIEGTGENRAAVCTVVRKGQEPKVVRFSMADAKKAKLLAKQGPWQDYPDRMLQMRARAWALRDAFADVLRGLGIAEEVRDVASETPPTPPTPPKPTPSQPVKAAPMPPRPPKPPVKAPEPPPPPPPEPEPEVVDDETGEVLTPSELLSELDDALGTARDVVQINDIWNDYDIQTWLESVPEGREYLGVAQGIKRRHLKRFE